MPTLIENRTLEENVALCRRLGLKFIELNMNFPEYGIEELEANTDGLISLAEAAGIYYTIHLDERLDIADFNPLVREAYLETVRRTIAVAKKLLPLADRYAPGHCGLVVNMHMNHGIYITLPNEKVYMYVRDFDNYMDAFKTFRNVVCEAVGDSNIRVAVENTDGFADYEKKAIEYLLESDRFILTWDIGHSKAVKEKDVFYLMQHAERINHFHIHDGSENPPKNHMPLGSGEIDLKDRLRFAKEQAGTNARCVLETKTIKALEESVGWLNEYLA